MRRVGKILMVALFATAVWTSSANAVQVFFNNCEVTRADMPFADVIVVNLSDLAGTPAFTLQWLLGVTSAPNQMLAVALTAISLGNQVMCVVDLDTSPPQIHRLILTDLPLP